MRGTGEGKSETEDSGGRLQEGRSGGELGRESWRQKDRRQWRKITFRREWRGTGEGKSQTEDSGGRLQEGGSGGELERESQRQKTVKGDYRKVGVEGNWGGKVRERRQCKGDYRKAGVEGNWGGKV